MRIDKSKQAQNSRKIYPHCPLPRPRNFNIPKTSTSIALNARQNSMDGSVYRGLIGQGLGHGLGSGLSMQFAMGS